MQHKIRNSIGLGAAALVIGGFVLVSGMITPRESMYLTDGPSYADVAELTNASLAVAHVKIVSAGNSYEVPFDAPVVNVAQPPADADKRKLNQSSAVPLVSHKETGILHTDFNVEVLDAIRGGNLKRGDRIVVSQLGGTQQDGVIASAEHDRLMQVNDSEVLFLRLDGKSGKYFTTGGGQGRFKVENNGTLSPIDSHSALARLNTGKPLSFLKGAVQSVQK